MPKTDAEIEQLEKDLAQAKADLAQMQDAAKQEALKVAKEKEEERKAEAAKGGADPKKEAPVQPKLDPDAVKEIAELKAKVAALEQQLGTSKKNGSSGYDLPDFFRRS